LPVSGLLEPEILLVPLVDVGLLEIIHEGFTLATHRLVHVCRISDDAGGLHAPARLLALDLGAATKPVPLAPTLAPIPWRPFPGFANILQKDIACRVSYTRYLIPMPNVISPEKRSVTYLENRTVFEWLENVAAARQTNVAVLLREATSAYFAQNEKPTGAPGLFEGRAAAKAAERAETARQIASGELSSAAAQERNAPIRQPVRISNLWTAVRRHARARRSD